MKILGTGLSGLVGSRIVELLKDKYEFDNLSLETGIDITDRQSIEERIISANPNLILHMAAKTDVDGCEKDKPLGENGDAWRINVGGTRNIADACEKIGKKLIYISTDFVFDGENPPSGGYSEKDKQNPIDWYGQTKYEGELIIQNSSLKWTIVRLAYPYRASYKRTDFARTLISLMRLNKSLSMIEDHIMTPTFIDDIAPALDALIENDATGIFHVVGSQFVSPYEAAILVADIFNLDKSLITKTTRKEFFKNRAPRPFHLALKNDKIKKLGVRMKTFEEGLRKVKSQIAKSL